VASRVLSGVGVNLLAGKFAVVTGGASGVGRAICLRFAEEGAAGIVVADLREEPREGGEPTHRLVERRGARAVFVRCDVSRVADLEAAVTAALDLGGLDVMVNNAGVVAQEDFLSLTEAEYDRIMDVNVKGVFFGAQAAARVMRERGGGSIINLSSVGGIRGSAAFVTYSASKGAVRLLTYSLGELLGQHGIRVNALHPGVIDTEMNRSDTGVIRADGSWTGSVPLGRSGLPADVAGAAVFLASDLAAYVNATSLVVDGGRLAV
jgi:NAD(P)-dependent dehydrogenase (short-subunit alcohol dehydrogenase family)